MHDSAIAAENIKLGDIYTVNVNQRYYFLQIVHIQENSPAPFGVNHEHGFNYFVVVLNDTFLTLPAEIGLLDLTRIYQPKYIWKNKPFYFSLWNKQPVIGFDPALMHYNFKDQYALIKFTNTHIAQTFQPAITLQTTALSLSFEALQALDNESIKNEIKPAFSAEPISIQMIIWAIEQEEKANLKKRK
jgi:hypothetical protein